MTFKPGQSGNPRGRPPKERALAAILERAGSHTLEVDDKKVSRKQLVARMLWEAATQGVTTFPGGLREVLTITEYKDWLDTVKFIYTHIDGPAKQTMEHTGKPDEPVRIEVQAIDYRAAASGLAPRSMGDRDASGENEDS